MTLESVRITKAAFNREIFLSKISLSQYCNAESASNLLNLYCCIYFSQKFKRLIMYSTSIKKHFRSLLLQVLTVSEARYLCHYAVLLLATSKPGGINVGSFCSVRYVSRQTIVSFGSVERAQ